MRNPQNRKWHEDDEPLVDPATLAAAEAAVAQLADEYLIWAQRDLQKLQKSFDAAQAATPGPDRKQALQALFAVAHDMKGQGGTFGYDLVTRIGHSLCRYVERDQNGTVAEDRVIAAHVAALRGVIGNRAKGDGGAVGQQIAKELEGLARLSAA